MKKLVILTILSLVGFIELFPALGTDKEVVATLKFSNGSKVVGKKWFFRYECRTPLEGNPSLYSVIDKRDRTLHLSINGVARSIPSDALSAVIFHWKPNKNGGVSQDSVTVEFGNGDIIRTERLISGLEGCDKIEILFPPEGNRTEWHHEVISYISHYPSQSKFKAMGIVEIRFGLPQPEPSGGR